MKREVIEVMLEKIDSEARYVYPSEHGLPVYDSIWMENMIRFVCKELNITLDEDPRIEAIMNYTGCSRKVAQDLIDSGEI